MKTKYIALDGRNPDRELVRRAALLLREGEVVAFPTETVYGLGANALDPGAVRKIFAAKGRPSDNPLIVHISDIDQLVPLVRDIPAVSRVLMEAFWPGPLTLIFPKSDRVPFEVTAGLETVAVRMPAHPVALSLIQQAEVPVAAPSANVSGRPSPTSGKHVWQDLEGKVAMVLDGGDARVGVESTVLDVTCDPPVILRPGGVTEEELEKVVGPVLLDRGAGPLKIPRSPGMKYTHYSPIADVFIIPLRGESFGDKFSRAYRQMSDEGRRTACLVSLETAGVLDFTPFYIEVLGSRKDLSQVAHRLFGAFRNADAAGADVILIEEFPETGMGAAVMNRMRKAAGNKVIN